MLKIFTYEEKNYDLKEQLRTREILFIRSKKVSLYDKMKGVELNG